MANWLVNGDKEERLSPDDRGLAYGDGLFETIALRDGKWRFLDLHLERLLSGCKRLGIPAVDPELIRCELDLAAESAREGTGKVMITRGSGARGYRPPDPPSPTRVIAVTQRQETTSPAWLDGVRVRYCKTPLSENPVLAGMKTLNRLEQVLARAEWSSPDIAEGLMMTCKGHVICGTMSNLFLVDEDTLLTPALDRCGVRGIMRRVILEEAVALGIPAREGVITQASVMAAGEVFISNSQRGIGPVTLCEDQPREVGRVTRRLMTALVRRGVRECATA